MQRGAGRAHQGAGLLCARAPARPRPTQVPKQPRYNSSLGARARARPRPAHACGPRRASKPSRKTLARRRLWRHAGAVSDRHSSKGSTCQTSNRILTFGHAVRVCRRLGTLRNHQLAGAGPERHAASLCVTCARTPARPRPT